MGPAAGEVEAPSVDACAKERLAGFRASLLARAHAYSVKWRAHAQSPGETGAAGADRGDGAGQGPPRAWAGACRTRGGPDRVRGPRHQVPGAAVERAQWTRTISLG